MDQITGKPELDRDTSTILAAVRSQMNSEIDNEHFRCKYADVTGDCRDKRITPPALAGRMRHTSGLGCSERILTG
ncbi:hypothetical protein [Loktanella salsilacus]|uniref:hypothetical protein n=1 Tax=Loktanella salsilacus TaxID=195913 RepID=UPI0037357874